MLVIKENSAAVQSYQTKQCFFERYIIFVPNNAQEKSRPVSNEVSEGISSVVQLVSTSIVGKKSIFVNVSHFSSSVIDLLKAVPKFVSYCSLFLMASNLLSPSIGAYCYPDLLCSISLLQKTLSHISPIKSLISILPRIDLRAFFGFH